MVEKRYFEDKNPAFLIKLAFFSLYEAYSGADSSSWQSTLLFSVGEEKVLSKNIVTRLENHTLFQGISLQYTHFVDKRTAKLAALYFA